MATTSNTGKAVLDRDAFTFTDYNLNVNIDPAQKRFEARGQVTLRNDSTQPQRQAAMQISSSLRWATIKLGSATTLDFTQTTIDSDVDHTGKVNEVMFALLQAVAPGASITLEVGYSGFIALDTTRLRRIGTPADIAERNDWDRISAEWTGLRGVGYVLWYPAELEPAELGDGKKVFDEISAWHVRHWQSSMEFSITIPPEFERFEPASNCNRVMVTGLFGGNNPPPKRIPLSCGRFGIAGPVFALGEYMEPTASVRAALLPATAAPDPETLTRDLPLATATSARELPQLIALPDPSYAAYDAGSTFITPLNFKDDAQARFILAHPLQHANFYSNRPWIYEGLAHLAQLRALEQQQGRAAVMAYLDQRRNSLALIEPEDGDSAETSLINAKTEIYFRTKAMFVWWMLHDMIPEQEFQRALAKYNANDDREPSYLQKLLEAESHRNLEPFFTDWVYRDRGLPDFKIDAVYPRQKVDGGYMLTITVENTGRAGAEVPIIVHTARGDISTRLELLGKDKASARVEVPVYPSSVTVNDGSVPESDTSNNEFEVPKAQ